MGVLKLRDGTRKSEKLYLLTRTSIKAINKFVNSLSRPPLGLGQATCDFGLTKLTTTRIRGKPHLPPYSILCASSRHLHPNGFLSQDSQGRVPKLSWFGLSQRCDGIAPCSNLRLGWSLKKTCSSHWELSNNVLHSTCTHRGRVNSRLLVLGSQLASLTLSLSFWHNLSCRCSNGSCAPIFDIYILITFPIIWITLQCEVFWPLTSSSKVLGVLKDSQVPISGVCISLSHSLKVGLWHWRRRDIKCDEDIAFLLVGQGVTKNIPHQVTSEIKAKNFQEIISQKYYISVNRVVDLALDKWNSLT